MLMMFQVLESITCPVPISVTNQATKRYDMQLIHDLVLDVGNAVVGMQKPRLLPGIGGRAPLVCQPLNEINSLEGLIGVIILVAVPYQADMMHSVFLSHYYTVVADNCQFLKFWNMFHFTWKKEFLVTALVVPESVGKEVLQQVRGDIYPGLEQHEQVLELKEWSQKELKSENTFGTVLLHTEIDVVNIEIALEKFDEAARVMIQEACAGVADFGVSMGIPGIEVAKETSYMMPAKVDTALQNLEAVVGPISEAPNSCCWSR
jgi:hypothetical protein